MFHVGCEEGEQGANEEGGEYISTDHFRHLCTILTSSMVFSTHATLCRTGRQPWTMCMPGAWARAGWTRPASRCGVSATQVGPKIRELRLLKSCFCPALRNQPLPLRVCMRTYGRWLLTPVTFLNQYMPSDRQVVM